MNMRQVVVWPFFEFDYCTIDLKFTDFPRLIVFRVILSKASFLFERYDLRF